MVLSVVYLFCFFNKRALKQYKSKKKLIGFIMNIRTNKFFNRVYYFGIAYMIGIVSWCEF